MPLDSVVAGMTPNAIWHAIDATTLSAGRKKPRRQYGLVLSLALVALAAAGYAL